MKNSSYRMDIQKMKDLVESLKVKATVQIGVFENKSARREGDFTNADLARIHEFGSPEHGLPARSMLHVPIAEHSAEIMSPIKGKSEEFLLKGKLEQLYKLMGTACEKVVDGAFQSGGYGKWAPLKYSTLLGKFKGNLKTRKGKLARIYTGEAGSAILIRTSQLRRAFSSRVKLIF